LIIYVNNTACLPFQGVNYISCVVLSCVQAAELNCLISTVTSCCKFTLNSFEDSTCGAMEVLIARRELTDRLKDLGISSVQSPAESDSLSFDVRRDDIASIQNAINGLGVVGTGGAVPFETTVTGDGTRQCWPNRPSTVTITARDRKGVHVRVWILVPVRWMQWFAPFGVT
jgi:hypothetical protein